MLGYRRTTAKRNTSLARESHAIRGATIAGRNVLAGFTFSLLGKRQRTIKEGRRGGDLSGAENRRSASVCIRVAIVERNRGRRTHDEVVFI